MWAKPKLFYAKHFTTLSSTQDAVGFPASNLVDMREGVVWKGASYENKITIAFADTNPDTLTDSDSGFLTAGFAIGQTFEVSGSASNDGNYLIAGVTAGTITLDAGDALVAESAGASVSLVIDQFIVPNTPASAVKVDYFGIAGHNLFTVGATVDQQYSTDDFSSDINSFVAPFIPTNNKTFVREGDQQSKVYHRLKLSGMTAAPVMAVVNFGETAILDYTTVKFDPDREQKSANVNVTVEKYVAGIHVFGAERLIRIKMNDVDIACHDVLQAWWEASGLNNFFFGWDTNEHPTEVYLMRPAKSFNNPLTSQGLLRDLFLDLVGRKE